MILVKTQDQLYQTIDLFERLFGKSRLTSEIKDLRKRYEFNYFREYHVSENLRVKIYAAQSNIAADHVAQIRFVKWSKMFGFFGTGSNCISFEYFFNILTLEQQRQIIFNFDLFLHEY